MPVCKSCLKGFNSDLNICPHCEHDQSKKSFRNLLTMILLVGLSIFLYTVFFSKYTITVLYDGVPKDKILVHPFMKPSQKTNKDGIVRLRKGFCIIDIPDGDEKLKWEFFLEADTTIKVNSKNQTLEIIQKKYIFIEESHLVTFASIRKLKQTKQALIQKLNNKK